MKCSSPKYKNESIEAKDVITSSLFEIEEITTENGEPAIVVTGYLSSLLGNMYKRRKSNEKAFFFSSFEEQLEMCFLQRKRLSCEILS